MAGNLSLRYFGSGRFVAKTTFSTLLKVFAGAVVAFAAHIGDWRLIAGAIVAALVLVFIAVAVDAGKFTRNLSGKIEYLYVDLGDTAYFNPPPAGFADRAGGVRLTDHIVRAGLNWQFWP